MKKGNIYLILLLVILSCMTSASTADESGQWDEHDSIDMDHTIFAFELDPPSISEPEDQVIEQGAAGEIIWKIKDKNPESYWVLRNGIQIVSPTSYKKSENIKVTIDTNTTGTWNYSIIASDESLNIASDHVEVEVILDDTSAPVITNPDDVTIDQGDEGRSIVWTITESNPGMCWVHKNGEEFVSQRSYYDGEDITVQIGSSTAGTQTYSLFASDISGNEASDQVDVTVTITSSDVIAPVITNPDDVTIDQGDEGRSIVWTITESNPGMCWVHKNGEEF
ncbi:MAG: hypothetical protein U9P81_05345, partial [Euryarchaeota archaeon]|nr:hypothetical protein [Euryarchaeota archaeon]